MKRAKILLLDCNPSDDTGEELDAILTSSHLRGIVRREVIADRSGIPFDLDWLRDHADSYAGVVFLILPGGEHSHGGDLIQYITKETPNIPIILVIDHCGPVETLDLLQRGAADFITPPVTAEDVLPRTWRQLKRMDPYEETVLHAIKERIGLKRLIGKTAVFLAQVKKIPLIAKCDSRVLITGETGTGKEVCARAIHYLSPRSDKPFIPVNCGAIPFDLMENELFGHDRGAFTGANTARAGLVEEADGGTLFLDEIDCLAPSAQVKLLRFLQDKEYRRLGSTKARYADVRLIVASNAEMEDAVQRGALRRDLYYRLSVVSIVLPPLRERREDIPHLANHFLEKYAHDLKKEVKTLSPEALQKLTFYDWPGNVRELEHTMERAVVFCETTNLTDRDIVLPSERCKPPESFQQAKAKLIEQFERDYIQRLLVSCNGNISRAAQAANKNRRAFFELIRKHRINVRNFKLRES